MLQRGRDRDTKGEARISTKGVRAVVGRRDIEPLIQRPVNESGLQQGPIPLRWRNSRMMQQSAEKRRTRLAAYCARLIRDFSPRNETAQCASDRGR